MADLAEHPLLLEPPGTAFRDDLDADAARAGVTLTPLAEVDGMRLLATLAYEGFGPAVLPADAPRRRLVTAGRVDSGSASRADRRARWASPPAGARCISAPGRAVADVLRQLVADEGRSHPGVHPAAPASGRAARAPVRSQRTIRRRPSGSSGYVAESCDDHRQPHGESIEIPIVDGGISATDLKKLLGNTWFYDPGYTQTAATSSAITEIDGDAGILRYRGYPIEQLAEKSTYLEVAYLLINGELPTAEQYQQWKHEITYHTFIHENVRKRFMEGFHYDAHPMGMLVSATAALSTFYLDAKDIFDPDDRDRQIVRLIAKMPTLAACTYRFSVGMPFVYPDNSLGFAANFLSMMLKVAEPLP